MLKPRPGGYQDNGNFGRLKQEKKAASFPFSKKFRILLKEIKP